MAKEVTEYSRSFWSQAALIVAGLGLLAGTFTVLGALVLKQMDRMTTEEVWWYVSIGLSGIGGAVVAGALGALVEEVRKLRWGLFQVNDLKREVVAAETRTEPAPPK